MFIPKCSLTIIDTIINVHLVKRYVPILVFVKQNK